MKFTPMTDEELLISQLIPAKEICEFEVLQSVDHVSEISGNKMIKVSLKVFYKNYSILIFDYLMTHVFDKETKLLVPSPKMQWKLKQFCKTTGTLDKFNSGNLEPSDFLDKIGVLKIGIQEDKDGKYPPRNSVYDYLDQPSEKSKLPNPQSNNSEWIEDDVPF